MKKLSKAQQRLMDLMVGFNHIKLNSNHEQLQPIINTITDIKDGNFISSTKIIDYVNRRTVNSLIKAGLLDTVPRCNAVIKTQK